ncbi:glycosyltransferase [Streptomyces sp. 891-h]|nr:glycosyltransferase [Streptomyces sp. 891-h]
MPFLRRAPLGPAPPPPDVPSVAVLVELCRSGSAGGHVKCWERFAEAAAHRAVGSDDLDLTVYVLGRREGVEELSPRVRFISLRPVFSARVLMPGMSGVDVTDLSPFHPRLAGLLPRHDIWHLTHAFAFSSTAVRLFRRIPPPQRPGLICSVHSDVPALASVYARQTLDRVPGLSRCACGPGSGLPDVVRRLARRRHERLLRMCDRVLAASPGGREEISAVTGPDRVSMLRRGVDHERFRPDPAARGELVRLHRVPADRPLVLFVGRVDDSKRAVLAAEAVHRLRRRGRAVHLVVVGSGADEDRVARLLGPDVTRLGPQPQHLLTRVYAGCDVFVFPSHTETVGNVVAEAMASRLPVLLPQGANTTQWLAEPGRDGIVVSHDTPEGWARALEDLLAHPQAREAMGQRAAESARLRHPSWSQVFEEDLLPVWHRTARRHQAR